MAPFRKCGAGVFIAVILLLSPLVHGAASPPDGFIVHFERGGRFAGSTPKVSRWLRSNVAMVRSATRHFASGEATLEAEMAVWRRLPGVRLVEPDAVGQFDGLVDAGVPNDPFYAEQTWLDLVGARGLWALGVGSGVTVAVVDSGVDLSHPDLQANLIDGYDFADNSAIPQDRIGHGTTVAGLLGAVASNGIGVTGLAPGIKIMPLKTSPDSGPHAGEPLSSAVAQAIDYAVAHGAGIINLSLTITTETEVVRQAVQEALDKGVIVVAAAGNEHSAVGFPANMPGVIAVANTQDDGSLHGSSNVGTEIALAAPGVYPKSTLLGGGYGVYGSGIGTSYSAPMVAAALAVLHGANPYLPPATLLSLLKSAAAPVPGYSFGVLQAGKTAALLVPDLQPEQGQAFASGNLSVAYRLPPTGVALDIYVAVDTPLGSFSLSPDGGWQPVSMAGYIPLASGYATSGTSGILFGSKGIFPAIPLAGLPTGAYNWRIALFDPQRQRLIGPVVSSTLQVVP